MAFFINLELKGFFVILLHLKDIFSVDRAVELSLRLCLLCGRKSSVFRQKLLGTCILLKIQKLLSDLNLLFRKICIVNSYCLDIEHFMQNISTNVM